MIEKIQETGSTNSDLAARLTRGDYLAEGTWLVADRQVAGRGRLGREWQDGAGNFMGSTIVHLRSADPAAETLALVAGLALHDLVAPLVTKRPVLKWPNDVLIDGGKLAGILLERVGQAVVIGIGANLASEPEVAGRRTASLVALGSGMDRDAFAAALVRQFEADLDRWRQFGLGPIVRRWVAAGHPIGTALQVDHQGQQLEGTFAGLTEGGALQLRLADGTLRVIHAGEVRIA